MSRHKVTTNQPNIKSVNMLFPHIRYLLFKCLVIVKNCSFLNFDAKKKVEINFPSMLVGQYSDIKFDRICNQDTLWQCSDACFSLFLVSLQLKINLGVVNIIIMSREISQAYSLMFFFLYKVSIQFYYFKQLQTCNFL